MRIEKAAPNDFDKARYFYHSLIDCMNERRKPIKWIKDVYPAPEFLRDSLDKGELYFAIEGDRVIAAMVVNHDFNEGYLKLGKETPLTGDDVMEIHALGVHPDFTGRGVGKAMVEEAIGAAGKAGVKGLRLDVLKGSETARRLYLRCGFQYTGSVQMYYENTGFAEFGLYEYRL